MEVFMHVLISKAIELDDFVKWFDEIECCGFQMISYKSAYQPQPYPPCW